MKYNIKSEIYVNKNYYYVTPEKDVYIAKQGLHLPYHPVISFKKFNDSSYYDRVLDNELVRIILKEESKWN